MDIVTDFKVSKSGSRVFQPPQLPCLKTDNSGVILSINSIMIVKVLHIYKLLFIWQCNYVWGGFLCRYIG